MGGEISAWLTAIVLTAKGVTFISHLFPPSIIGYSTIPQMGRYLVRLVAVKYPQLGTEERQAVKYTLSFITNFPEAAKSILKKLALG